MSLELEVDASGCRGRFVQHQPGLLPSLGTLVRWGLTLSIPMGLFFAMRAPRQGVMLLAALLFATLVVQYTTGGDLGSWLSWEAEQRPVTHIFEVRGGVLSVSGPDGTQTAPLADARVTRFEDGVQVHPALGGPVQLTWDGATANDVARLATLLESASEHRLDERGTSQDVPAHLRDLEQLGSGEP